MLFQRKIDRVLGKQNTENKENEKIEIEREKVELEKKDVPALFLAAFLTFVPAILIVVLIFVAVIWFMFLR